MKSSMISVARFFSSYFEFTDLIAVEDGFGLNGFKAQRSMDMPEILQALGCLVLQAQILSESIYSRDCLGHRAVPSSQAATLL